MSLETHIAGSEDRLIDGLFFGSRNTASYVIARKAATFHPSSASSWRPSGVRLMRFNLADAQSGWLDGSTVRLCFTLTNNSPNWELKPICDSPASMLRRVRVVASGSATIEDIEEYGRTYELFSQMLPSVTGSFDVPFTVDAIPADSSRQVVVTLLSSFLSQGKMIPLSMLPITIECELDDADAAFLGTNNTWEITRPRLLADVCDIDTHLANSFFLRLRSHRHPRINVASQTCAHANEYTHLQHTTPHNISQQHARSEHPPLHNNKSRRPPILRMQRQVQV